MLLTSNATTKQHNLKKKNYSQKGNLTWWKDFLSKYERVKIANLPPNIHVRRNRTISPRRQRRGRQCGHGIKSILEKVYNLEKRAIN